MARAARVYSKLNIYTIVLRGKADVFSSPSRKSMFLCSVADHKQDVSIYAYAITNTDAYMVVSLHDQTISQFVKRITVSFARKYNLRYGIGNVFYDRYLSSALEDSDSVLTNIKNVNNIALGDNAGRGYISSYTDYFNDAIIDTSFVLSHPEFNIKTVDDNLENMLYTRKLSDYEVADYIYSKYKIRANEMRNLSKDTLTNILSELMRVTKVSARQVARVTTVPVRFIWALKKKIVPAREDA